MLLYCPILKYIKYYINIVYVVHNVCFLFIFSENLCPITFQDQLPVRESAIVHLRCSTLDSCPLRPVLSVLPPKKITYENRKICVAQFTARWEDDGMEISCQVENNKDPYLIRKIKLTVYCELRNCS